VDGRVAVWVASHRWHPLDGVFVHLGDLGRLGAVFVVLAFAVTLARRQGLPLALLHAAIVAVAAFAADSVSFGIKDLVERPRPFVAHPQIEPLYTVHSSSFPAGHAATAFAGATVVAAIWRRGWPLFFAIAVAIAFSRVYVGVHYPGDVLAGAAVGTAVGLLAVTAARMPHWRRAPTATSGRPPRRAGRRVRLGRRARA
jgi:undecaprenyl-diphosphatase